MDINFKQHEIVAALKTYIVSQGINLTGKTLTVAFTAGRKESGISAEVSINEDAAYVASEPEAQVKAPVPVVPVVTEEVKRPHAKKAEVSEGIFAMSEPEPEQNEPSTKASTLAYEGEQPKPAVSLFG